MQAPLFRALHSGESITQAVGLASRPIASRHFDAIQRSVGPKAQNSRQRCCVAQVTKHAALGIARHWQPVLRMYIRPFTTSRTSTFRLRPPRLAGGISGAI